MNRTGVMNRIELTELRPIARPRSGDRGEIEVYEPLQTTKLAKLSA